MFGLLPFWTAIRLPQFIRAVPELSFAFLIS
jgi:hypothetical protein